MKAILAPRSLAALLSLLFLCSGADADSIHPQLPSDVVINKEAGCGGYLIVTVRLEDGEELPMLVDTGTPITLLNKSLAPRLGKRLLNLTLFNFSAKQESGVFAAPKLWLGGAPLKTDSYIATYDFKRISSFCRRAIMGILGMDCMRHYCIQLDFVAGKMRFLDSNKLNLAELGQAFRLTYSTEGQHPPPLFADAGQDPIRPLIQHAGLFGGTSTNSMIDTGDNVDGSIDEGALKGHFMARFIHFFIRSRALRVSQGVWDGETYTELKVGEGRHDNRLGLRFLARHRVTFDFPDQMIYLHQTSIDPLAR
jgi:hypothetical protein